MIRRETVDDADAVAAVHVRGWRFGYAGIVPEEVLARLNPAVWAQRRRDLDTAAGDHPFTTLVAEDDGAVTGFVTFGPYRNQQDPDDLVLGRGEVLSMYVEPARWGTGVGRSLLAGALAGLRGHGCADVRLWVLADNARARRFYERAGLRADGERSTYEIQLSGGRPPVGLAEIRLAARLDEL
ncbi:GNAT family N-acetyltransferase [Micromonospora zhanjiangensis]